MKITYAAVTKRFEAFVAKYDESERREVRRLILEHLLADAFAPREEVIMQDHPPILSE